MSLIGLLFVAIIGLYAWSLKVYSDMQANIENSREKSEKELAAIYKVVNGHLQDARKHGDSAGYVKTEVCNALHKALTSDVAEMKQDIKTLLKRD